MLAELYPTLAPYLDLGLIEQALVDLDAMAHQVTELNTRIEEVKAQGMAEASPHWRDGKYLYLIHPQRNGERKREYIGADPGAQKAALQRVENWSRYQELERERDKAQGRLRQSSMELRYTLRQVTGKW